MTWKKANAKTLSLILTFGGLLVAVVASTDTLKYVAWSSAIPYTHVKDHGVTPFLHQSHVGSSQRPIESNGEAANSVLQGKSMSEDVVYLRCGRAIQRDQAM